MILLGAATVALILANTPLAGMYESIAETRVGPAAQHLDLTVREWTADGLLAVFFYVAGCELKRELVVGELASFRGALLPVAAALGGMVAPALVCLAVGAGTDGIGAAWPVTVATDIAFALAVLAITASRLPPGIRVFLLSLAVVDDLGAILLIALLYTGALTWWALAGAVAALALFWVLQYARVRSPFVYVPLALLVWTLVHASGLHATLAGVALGLLTRVQTDENENHSPAERMEHLVQPLSAGVCVPLFAFFAAGVPITAKVVGDLAANRLALAVIAGLLIGKCVGVFGGAMLAVRLRLAQLPRGMGRRDLLAVSVLGGCGFTVSLLIAKLAFEDDPATTELLTLAVLIGSVLASAIAAGLLRLRVRARPQS